MNETKLAGFPPFPHDLDWKFVTACRIARRPETEAERAERLRDALDELTAEFRKHHRRRRLSETTVLELFFWSNARAQRARQIGARRKREAVQ